MIKVLATGIFDNFHPGHESYLKQASEEGDELIVIVGRDNTASKLKGAFPLQPEKERLKKIRSLDYVDVAVLGSKERRYSILGQLKPDIICLGYDQSGLKKKIKEVIDELRLNIEIKKMKAFKPDIYKSSLRGKQNG